MGRREPPDQARVLGQQVTEQTVLAGGDICRVVRCTLLDGRVVVVKYAPVGAPSTMFAHEAAGLAWLAEVDGMRVPAVLDCDERRLVLSYVEPCEEGDPEAFDAAFGAALARSHRAAPVPLGLDHDNLLAGLPQPNGRAPSWPAFMRDRRVYAALEALEREAAIDAATASLVRAASERFDALLETDEPAVRLHGDLWRGNVLRGRDGAMVWIDPAVYGGDREVDLAMLATFGGWSDTFAAAYDRVYPRRPRWELRLHAYRLYPLLTHMRLFGGAYAPAVRRAARGVIDA